MKLSSPLSQSFNWLRQIFFLLLCLVTPALVVSNIPNILQNHWISILVIALTFILSNITLKEIQYVPGYQTAIYITSTVFVWFAILLLFVMVFRLPYSRSYVMLGGVMVLLVMLLYAYLNRQKKHRIGYIPTYDQYDLRSVMKDQKFVLIEEPKLPEEPIEYLVVDLNHPQLSSDWLKFISNCSLQNITVINAKQLLESYTGRVTIDRLSENELGTLQPSYLYSKLKRLIDIFSIILSLPLLIPILLITAVIIKLESKGPAIFTQKRVGYRGKEFKIYKFRSMYTDSEEQGAQFASLGDQRVTPFGKIIRKLRIDELPQFFNIIKGDMSLIGPRPEQKTFVEQFENEIPFYNYRH
ncbi:MAG: sugar transferase, partial [Neisseriaceae bacterium]|nr:sugar transferase [Neisseriaceae bacterium]